MTFQTQNDKKVCEDWLLTGLPKCTCLALSHLPIHLLRFIQDSGIQDRDSQLPARADPARWQRQPNYLDPGHLRERCGLGSQLPASARPMAQVTAGIAVRSSLTLK